MSEIDSAAYVARRALAKWRAEITAILLPTSQQQSGKRQSDSTVYIYQWAILGGHLVVVAHFLKSSMLSVLSNGVEPLCWPYFENCWRFRFSSPDSTGVVLVIYIILIIATGFALAIRHWRASWILLAAMNLYLFAVISLDYRLRGNQYYMLLWIGAVLLLWSNRRWAIPLTLISFYFWAGTLKLNYEWLSGADLYRPLFIIPQRFASVACIYVVILETIFIWGLLSKTAWVRWLVLLQLTLFHVESISQVNWFYPLMMAALLSWFVIDWSTNRQAVIVSIVTLCSGRAPRSAYFLLLLFTCCQLAPYFYRGDKMLTGQGRIFALDMLEARQVCDIHALIHHRDHAVSDINLLMPNLPPRKICDPIIYFDRMIDLCRTVAKDNHVDDVDFVMHARRTTDATLSTIVDEKGFCAKRETYSIFSNNSWMK